MALDLKNIRYYLMPGNQGIAGFEKIYENCYEMWKKIWSQALVDLNSPQQIFSDGFSRQTKIGCLFYEDKCVGMTAFRDVDFSNKINRDDSLLRSWTPEAFDLLLSDGPRVSICSYLSVDPAYRGEIAPEISLKLLAVLMSTKCLINSDCDVMTGTMRCNRGTDKSAYRAGARFLQKAKMYDVDVDLVGFFKKDIQENSVKYSHLWADYLWNNRVDLMGYAENSKNIRKSA